LKAKKKKKAVHHVKSTLKDKQTSKKGGRSYTLSKSSVKGPKGTTKIFDYEGKKKGVTRTKSSVTRKTKKGSIGETTYTKTKGRKTRTKNCSYKEW